ncbi:MAG: flagellar basal body rod protein FlgB [Immundisolibacteraceae bacterium]|nr:flagellar basal body rod protein FlgB [Immundisolibacteraceae bacterium]
MTNSSDALLGLPATALVIHEQRNQLLASNIANADTPGYKARDLDFRAMLKSASSNSAQSALRTTSRNHISQLVMGPAGSELLYRIPMQNSQDGNTVEADIEQAAYGENSVRFQAAVRFVDGRAKSLLSAIRGD